MTKPRAQRSRPRRTRRSGAIGRVGHLVMVLALLTSTLAVDATLRPQRAEASGNGACDPDDEVVEVVEEGKTFMVLQFTVVGTCDWTVPADVTAVDYLVVAGGGGGGSAPAGNNRGGGGGAGGLLAGTLSVGSSDILTVVVGEGGLQGSRFNAQNVGAKGGDSVLGSGDTAVTAVGGGGGATNFPGGSGGSGGGGGAGNHAGGSGTSGQGFSGGNGTQSRPASGGGAGGAGQSATDTTAAPGGPGVASTISGSTVTYAVGGASAPDGARDGAAGTANRGNGGQGAVSGFNNPQNGGVGGSGIVIIRYELVLAIKLALTWDVPESAPSGGVLSPGPTVEIHDDADARVPGTTDQVTAFIVGEPDGVSLSGNVESAVDGVATFRELSIDGPVGQYTLEFRSGSLTPVTAERSFTLTVGAASAVRSTITAASATSQAEGSWQSVVTVQLKDSGGNPLTSGAGLFVLSTDLGTLSGVTDAGDGSYTAVLTSSVSGTATITGTINDAAMDPASVTFTAGSTVQEPPLEVTSTSGTFDGNSYALALTVSGGSGIGAVSYAVVTGGTASGCSVSGATLTATSVGTCLVTATKAGDSQFAEEVSPQATVTFTKAARTLSFGRPASVTLEYGAVEDFVATPSAGGGTVTYAVSGADCSVTDATVVRVRIDASTGSCVVSASVPEETNYLAATAEVSIVPTRRALTISGGSPTVNFGTTYTPTALANSGRLVGNQAVDSAQTKYTFEGTVGTVYGPSTTPPVDAGTYTVLPFDLVLSPGAASDYDITYVAGFLEIRRVARTVAFTSAASVAVQYGDTTTVVAAPSVGDGAVVYAVSGSSDACTVAASSGVVTVTSASGTCEVQATITDGTNHLDATTTSSVTVTVSARPITVTAADRTVAFGTAVVSGFSVTTGSLASTDRISALTFTYEGTGSTTYATSTTAPTAIGTYSVTPSVAVFGSGSDADYTIVYAAGTLTIVAPPPPPPPGEEPDDGFGTTSSDDSTSGGSGAPNSGGTGTPGASDTSGTGQTDVRPGSSVDPDAPAGPTVEVTQGEPAPEVDRSTGGRPVLAAGQFSVTSGGITEAASMSGLDGRMGMTVEGEGWTVTVEVVGGDAAAPASGASTVLRFDRFSVGTATGTGFLPGTRVTVWIFSEPVRLATVSVDGDGGFTLEFLVNATMILPGEHTLQVQGVGQDGLNKAVNVGVVVEPLDTVIIDVARGREPWNGRTLVWWALAVLLLGVAGAGVATRAWAART